VLSRRFLISVKHLVKQENFVKLRSIFACFIAALIFCPGIAFAKQSDSFQAAVVRLKSTDLSKPTLETVLLAAYAADTEILETLHKNGFADWKNPKIIINASFYGSPQLIEQLIGYGAALDAKSNRGETVLHGAVRGGNIRLLDWYLSKGLDVQVKDQNGRMLLFTAASCGDMDMFKYLLSKGLDVRA
jgi:hypothetical protein